MVVADVTDPASRCGLHLFRQPASQEPTNAAAEGGGWEDEEPAHVGAVDGEAEADAEQEAAGDGAGDGGGEAEPDDVGAVDHGAEVGLRVPDGKRGGRLPSDE